MVVLDIRADIAQPFVDEGARLAAPRLVCAGPVITTTAGQLWWEGIECDTEDELRRAVRTLVKNGVDFIKLMGSGGNATPGSNPELSQYQAAGFHAVATDAHRMGSCCRSKYWKWTSSARETPSQPSSRRCIRWRLREPPPLLDCANAGSPPACWASD